MSEEQEKVLEQLAVYKEDFSLLLEVGFVAMKQSDEISARRLFAAAQVLSPGNTAPLIGIGQIHLNKFEIKQATTIFQQILEMDPNHELAQCFLAMCYMQTKDKMKKGEDLLKVTMEKTTSPTIKNLAVSTLEWANDILKKKKDMVFYDPSKDDKKEPEPKKP